jgi:hypothetical protein
MPPLTEPPPGATEVTLGGSGVSAKVKTPFRVALSPWGVVTTTSATPVPLGVVAWIETVLKLVIVAEAPPIVTIIPFTRLLPEIRTASPPLGDPEVG